jgi:hypothetical protein
MEKTPPLKKKQIKRFVFRTYQSRFYAFHSNAILFPLVLGSSDWRWRHMCCVPLVFSFEVGLIITTAEISLLIIYYTQLLTDETG